MTQFGQLLHLSESLAQTSVRTTVPSQETQYHIVCLIYRLKEEAVSYLLQGLMVHRQGLNLNALHCAITQILAVLSFMLIHQVSGTMLQIILTLGFVAALFLFRVVQVEDLKKTAQILRRP